jgi:uncharacterized cupredoxin-like copper-binding protein
MNYPSDSPSGEQSMARERATLSIEIERGVNTMTTTMKGIGTTLGLVLLLLFASVLLAACGGDDNAAGAPSADDAQLQDDGDDHAADDADDGHDDDGDDHAADIADDGHDDDGHDGGEALAAEADQVMDFELNDFGFLPAQLTIEAGQVVQLNVENTGYLHDFTIEKIDADVFLDMPEMGDHAGMEGPPADMHFSFMEPGNGVLQLRVHEPGEYVFYCSVPGHRDLGMEGTLIVEATDTVAARDDEDDHEDGHD